MKLTELRPCVVCRGALVGPGKSPIFYVLRVSQALLDRTSTNQVLGLTQIWNGAIRLAEVMAPDAEGAVKVLGDEAPELQTTLFLCQDCALMKTDLGLWIEACGTMEEARKDHR